MIESLCLITKGSKTPIKHKTMKRNLLLSFGLAALCLTITETNAQDGAELFRKNCTACHKLGAKLVGPDLTGVTDRRSNEWLHKFISSSQGLIASGDADAVKVFEENNKMVMPDQVLTSAEIDMVLAYLKEASAPATSVTAEAPPAEAEKPVEFTDADREAGRELFDGSNRLSGGGPSCISCHNVNHASVMLGGGLAKDLTNVFGRMGHAGVSGILSAPPFPAMASSYGNAPLTESEIHQLTAFLAKADAESATQVAHSPYSPFLTYGLGGLVAILMIIGIAWHARLRNSVKSDIFNRQIKSI